MRMKPHQTMGQKLSGLRERSGLSLSEVAKRAGYKGPSSVQAMFSADYDVQPLGMAIGDKLWRAFEGTGDPPISYDEIWDLCSGSAHYARSAGAVPVRPWRAPEDALRPSGREDQAALQADGADRPNLSAPKTRDIPVYGTALAAEINFGEDGDGELIEQTVFEMGETILYVRRPVGLSSDAEAYGLYVSGSSMEPRYRPGDPLVADPKRPPSIGDDVVVQLVSLSDGEPDINIGLIKTLVRRTGSYLELEQYHPPVRFRVPMERVARIHRVIPPKELLGF